jgi:hypothetical protein
MNFFSITDLSTVFRAQAVTAPDLPGHLAAAPVIILVTEKFPADGRKGGHLVVARGYHDTPSGDADILSRDPSGWGQTCDRVPLSRLAASYTGRCITFAPLTPATEGA